MTALVHAIRFSFPNANPITDFRIENDGTGERIAFWNTATLGTQPTETEIDAAKSAYEAAKVTSDAAAATEVTRAAGIRGHARRVELMGKLKTATAAEISTWVDNNATTLPAAREILKGIILAIALDLRNGA